MKYRLIEPQKTPVTLYMFPKTLANGRVSYSHYQRLEPDEVYVTNDEAQKEYLRAKEEKVRYNADLEYALKSANVPFEVILCKSCGGKVKKIKYSVIEVLEDE